MRRKSSKSIGRTSTENETSGSAESTTLNQSMSSAAGSHARTYHETEACLESTDSERDCFKKLSGWFVRLDRNALCWRTSQGCLMEGSERFCGIWPRSGSMLNGMCFRRVQLVPTRFANGFSFWPTPNTVGWRGDGELIALKRRVSTTQEFVTLSHRAAISKRTRHWPESRGLKPNGTENPQFLEWLMGFPEDWTAVEDLETPSSHKSQNGSDAE